MKELSQNIKKAGKILRFVMPGILMAICFLIMSDTLSAKDIETIRKELDQERSGLPENLSEKPLVADSIKTGEVDVYTDADLIEVCAEVKGEGLTITATAATKEAIYGEYVSGDASGSGWFSLDTFIVNPSFSKEYATVREEMPVYKNKNFKQEKATIEKYSGIILVSKSSGKRQVLYETKDSYGIGWMKGENYENTLEYDGRPKQILADGNYDLRSISTVEKLKKGGKKDNAFSLTFVYVKENKYYIFDQNNRWLGLNEEESGLEQGVIWNKKGQPTRRNLFLLKKTDRGYQIRHDKTGYVLGESVDGTLKVYTEDMGMQTEWKISTDHKMVDVKQPMVFTQYDPEWCGLDYGSEGCIGTAGCGILSTVNAVYALSGQYIDVMELADYAVEKNYRIVGSGTADGIFKAAAKKYGDKYSFAWDGKSEKISVLIKKLKAGDTAVSHVEGHYVAIVSCSEDGKKFLLLDSNRLPFRETSAYGDWVDVKRLKEGPLSSTGYFFFKQQD